MGLINIPERQRVFQPIGMPQVDWEDPLNRGVVGFWPIAPYEFGGKVIHDLSGNDNTGVFVNTPAWLPGKFGSAIKFIEAESDYIDCGNKSVLNLTTALTLSVWVKFDSLVGSQEVIVKSGGYFWIGSYVNNPYFLVYTGGNDTITGSTVLNITDWFHLVGTWSTADNTMRLYVNGVPDGTQATAGNINDNLAAVLKIGGDAAVMLPGCVGCSMIYNRVLTTSEVALLYQRMRSI